MLYNVYLKYNIYTKCITRCMRHIFLSKVYTYKAEDCEDKERKCGERKQPAPAQGWHNHDGKKNLENSAKCPEYL